MQFLDTSSAALCRKGWKGSGRLGANHQCRPSSCSSARFRSEGREGGWRAENSEEGKKTHRCDFLWQAKWWRAAPSILPNYSIGAREGELSQQKEVLSQQATTYHWLFGSKQLKGTVPSMTEAWGANNFLSNALQLNKSIKQINKQNKF